MADLRKITGIPRDCSREGARGERGRRGHHGHDGATGLRGETGPPGPPGTGRSSILWSPTGGGDATTFAEVMAFVAANAPPLDIYVEGNVVIPVGVFAMKGSGFIASPDAGGFTVTMADGAQLENLGFIEGSLALVANSTVLTPLVFNAATGGSPDVLFLRFNAALQNDGSVPMIEVPNNIIFVLSMIFNGALLVGGPAPVVNGGVGSVIIIGALGAATISDNWLTGPGGCTLIYQNVGGVPSPLPTNVGFVGSTVQNVLTGVSCTGPATRPTNPFGAQPIGTPVFDQSLGVSGLPIWWDGTQWIDATGAPA